MNLACYNQSIPDRRRLLPAQAPCAHLGVRGFLFASLVKICYDSVSPWSGKLRAMFQAFGIRLWCSHGSDEKPVEAGVSCVGRLRRMNRDVACTPRRLSAGLAGDRKQLTNAHDDGSANKTGQRRPATQWATRRKASVVSHRATGTKDPRFGLTERVEWTNHHPFDTGIHQTPSGIGCRAGKWPEMVVVRTSSASAPLIRGFLSHFCDSVHYLPTNIN
jgi:hypothetical protein